MLATSFEFRKRIAQNSKTLHKATLTLANGVVVELTGDDLMQGTSFSESVSSQSSFDVGAAVIGRHDFRLKNDTGKFDDYDFTGATIIPYVGVELGDGTVEWLRKGIYGIEQPDSYSNTIGLSALDNMRLFETPYADVSTAYPATLLKIATDICTACNMTLATTEFANYSVSIAQRPNDDSITCLDMVSYIAQASGNWAKCDTLGRLCFGWYDTSVLEGVDWVDGGTFETRTTPYSDGDVADGGGFHTEVDSYDGGSFGNIPYAHLFAFSSLTVSTDDVVITGVRVTAEDEHNDDDTRGEAGETVLYGSEGYVLEISGNKLIQYGTASAAATRIGLRCVGMRFRPFSASVVGDPSYEAGDPVIITDGKQRQYKSFITNNKWSAGSYEQASCGAETPSRNSATSFSAITKATVEMRNSMRAEMTAREIATQTMALMLSSASGLYKSEDVQSDGSVVYYLHDKPTLSASQTVWKATAEAFGVSNDGGQTYSYGVSNNGVAILNQIYAQGINADYIDTGALTVRDTNNNIIFRASVEDHFTNIGGLYAADGLLYNDSLGLSAAGLYFYYTDNGTRYTVGGLWPGRLVDSSNRMLGQLELWVPSSFNVRSFYPYNTSDSGVYVIQYSRQSSTFLISSSISTLYVNPSTVYMTNVSTVNYSTTTDIYDGRYRRASIFSSTIQSGCRLGGYFYVGNGIYNGREELYSSEVGARIHPFDGFSFGEITQWGSLNKFIQCIYQYSGILFGDAYMTDRDGAYSYICATAKDVSTTALYTRIASDSGLILLAPKIGVSDFAAWASTTTYLSGQSGTITYVSEAYISGDNLHVQTKTVTFEKGFMVTVIT